MIAAKTIRTQRHPKIPKSAAIEWHFYLQVELTQISRRKRERKEEIHEKTENEDEESHDKAAAAAEKKQKRTDGVNKSEGDADTKKEATEVENEKEKKEQEKALPDATKAALAEVRKMHRTWDRFSRDSKSVKSKSEQNENTTGSKILTDLGALLDQGADLDTKILDF